MKGDVNADSDAGEPKKRSSDPFFDVRNHISGTHPSSRQRAKARDDGSGARSPEQSDGERRGGADESLATGQRVHEGLIPSSEM